MKDNFHRTACSRQHHMIGHYLAVQAWNRRLDCIVLDRVDLEFFLGLQRFKGSRVRWLKEDLRPWFPHHEDYYRTGAESSIRSLFLSRVPIGNFLPSGSMTTHQRIKRMLKGAPATALFSDSQWLKQRPSETEMLSQLMLLASGVATPETFKPRPRARPRSKLAAFTDPFKMFTEVFGPQKKG